MENKQQFKPFERILVRDGGKWTPDIYSYYRTEINKHWCLSCGWMEDDNILPYEGNEHLVGTTDEPEEEIELMEGEWLMVCNTITDQPDEWMLRYLLWAQDDNICIQSVRFAYPDPCGYNYAIRFSDFNPEDMEETKKHILCAKNGKIVRYKE